MDHVRLGFAAGCGARALRLCQNPTCDVTKGLLQRKGRKGIRKGTQSRLSLATFAENFAAFALEFF